MRLAWFGDKATVFKPDLLFINRFYGACRPLWIGIRVEAPMLLFLNKLVVLWKNVYLSFFNMGFVRFVKKKGCEANFLSNWILYCLFFAIFACWMFWLKWIWLPRKRRLSLSPKKRICKIWKNHVSVKTGINNFSVYCVM